jgi:hypothetical protein
MAASTETVALTAGIRRPIASAYTAVVIIENTGSAPTRVVTELSYAGNGRTIAPGETVELETQGFTIYLVADAPTTVAVTKYSVMDLRADAADEFNVPVEPVRGRTKAEIGDAIVRFLSHSAGPDTPQEGSAA